MSGRAIGVTLALCLVLGALLQGQTPAPVSAHFPKLDWKNGAWSDANFFPLSVWMQPSSKAKKYRDYGVNIYMNQWKGPTEKQFGELREAGMAAMFELNDVAYKHKDDPLLVGWLQEDEPDVLHSNANDWPELKARKDADWTTTLGQYQAVINPKTIQDRYKLLKAVSDKPVCVGFSFGFLYPQYAGRGHRKGHPEDYAEYVKGADIVGYDIYPGIHQYTPAAGKYWVEAWGVKKLVELTKGQKIVWPTIEACAPRLDHGPKNYKAEVWMALVYGAMGINYWVHQNSSGVGPVPSVEDSVFLDPNMASAFKETNALITSLAPVLNSPTVADGTAVRSSEPPSEEAEGAGVASVAVMTKSYKDATYVFAVRMEDTPARGEFEVKGLAGKLSVEVIGEDRRLGATDGKFADDFKGMEVHLYKIAAGK